MTRLTRRYSQWAAAILLAAALAGCQESDVVAPDGATISLTANPATIVLVKGVQASKVTIIATVSNSIGVPLPGQDVRFTTTAGTLTPTAGTPVETDQFGNATADLTLARQAPTITAKSGKVEKTLQLQTATCALNVIAVSPSPLLLKSCNDPLLYKFDVTAVATDTAGAFCTGILIKFTITGSDPPNDVDGSFIPSEDTTDSSGLASSTLTIDPGDCTLKCAGKTCTGFINATSGSVSSSNVLIEDTVP